MNEANPDLFFSAEIFAILVRSENRDLPPLEREWVVLSQLGKKLVLDRLILDNSRTSFTHLSDEEILTEWDLFIDHTLEVMKNLQLDLGILAPDEIVVSDFLSNTFAKQPLAGASTDQEGRRILTFYTYGLYVSFANWIGGKRLKKISKSAGRYSVAGLLAHEMRHFYQLIHYPKVVDKQFREENPIEYYDRVTELDARLYELKYLRSLKPSGLSDSMGLWLVKAEKLLVLRKMKKRKRGGIKS